MKQEYNEDQALDFEPEGKLDPKIRNQAVEALKGFNKYSIPSVNSRGEVVRVNKEVNIINSIILKTIKKPL